MLGLRPRRRRLQETELQECPRISLQGQKYVNMIHSVRYDIICRVSWNAPGRFTSRNSRL